MVIFPVLELYALIYFGGCVLERYSLHLSNIFNSYIFILYQLIDPISLTTKFLHYGREVSVLACTFIITGFAIFDPERTG